MEKRPLTLRDFYPGVSQGTLRQEEQPTKPISPPVGSSNFLAERRQELTKDAELHYQQTEQERIERIASQPTVKIEEDGKIQDVIRPLITLPQKPQDAQVVPLLTLPAKPVPTE